MADPVPLQVSWRFSPFTEAYTAVLVSDEDRLIPSSSPFEVRLYEVPRKDSISTVSCVILVALAEALDAVETGVNIWPDHYDRIQVNDVLLVDDEQMLVTGLPGTPTVTVTRGYGGTGADTHTIGTIMEILASMTEITSGSPASREFRVDYKYSTGLVLFNTAEQGYDVRFDYWGLGTPLHAAVGWHTQHLRPYGIGSNLHPDAKCSATDVVGSVAWFKFKEMQLDRAGDLRIKFAMRKVAVGGNAYGQIWRNGSPVGTIQTKSLTTWTTFSEDIAGWEVGDLVQLYSYRDGGQNGEVKNLWLYIDELIQVDILNN